MAVRSFQRKLLYLLIVVLILLQLLTLAGVHLASRRTLRKTITNELDVGARVLGQILASRGRRLSDSTRVLALDFAFRGAIASSDLPTITSVLANHGSRVSANAVLLVGLDGKVNADTLDGKLIDKPFPFPSLLRKAEDQGEASATVSFAGRPYQFVVVPVLAPKLIAWLAAGFEIDKNVLHDVQDLTSLHVSVWSGTSANPNLVTTLLPEERNDLLRQMPTLSIGARPVETVLPLHDAAYASLMQRLPTADGSPVYTVLQKSMAEAQAPFTRLELQIVMFSSLILGAAIVAAVVFSRSVTKPLRILADGAGRIERGDYVSPIVVEQKDEFGHLATAFNQMQTAIAAREDQIIHQATHDGLTGLPNRTLFLDRLSQAIVASKRAKMSVGMIMMDVDRFKEINDTLGHHLGDQLLIEIGSRLSRLLRQSDTVARLGGDEFAVKFTAANPEGASEVARRIETAFEAPFVLGEVSVDIDASLGIALYPMHAEDADTLMKRADIAMYDAKKNHSGFAMYEAGRDEHSLRRLTLMMELRQAVSRDELELFYQPKIDVARERAVHAEALVRWNHPRHGVMRPDEFIPLAEQSGNIGYVTKWVLRKAIEQCAMWSRTGLELTVAVNLSALDLFDSDLPTYISGLVSEAKLSPKCVVLEITEGALMKDPAYALKILSELKNRELTLAIDDFGTGYSSLAYLKRLPVDELKIDKSFVTNLTESDSDDLVIVRSTIELGHNMGLMVVAEGVETADSWRVLKKLRCDLAQGYFMSPPLPDEKFREWMVSSPWGRGEPVQQVVSQNA